MSQGREILVGTPCASFEAMEKVAWTFAWVSIVLLAQLGCEPHASGRELVGVGGTSHAATTATPQAERVGVDGDDANAQARATLVETIKASGISDAAVLAAIGRVPRHEFVPLEVRHRAYDDRPLPIGEGQTISQPSLVALMTVLADVKPNDKVLEIGTGSGYQSAVLSALAAQVYTIEIVEPLARRARADLERLGYAKNIQFRIGNGYEGWPEAAPFDAIVVTAAPATVPPALVKQLKPGGKLVIPVGETEQRLRVLEKTAKGIEERQITPVRFVPMIRPPE